MKFDWKKIGVPLACMVIGVLGSIGEFITAMNEKDIDTLIDEKINERLGNPED